MNRPPGQHPPDPVLPSDLKPPEQDPALTSPEPAPHSGARPPGAGGWRKRRLGPRALAQAALALVAGALMALPYWVEPAGPAIIAGIALWALSLDPFLFRRRILIVYLEIFLFVGAGLFWLYGFHPAAPFVLAAYFGLYGIPMAWSYGRLRRAGSPSWAVLPWIWVGIECLLRHVSLLRTSWLNLGYALLPLGPLAQTADLWGVAGLTFMVGLAAGLLADGCFLLLRPAEGRPRHLVAGALLLAVLAGSGVLYGRWREATLPDGPEVQVLLVQGNIPQAIKIEPMREAEVFRRHLDLTLRAAGGDLDLIVWPESSASVFPDTERGAPWREVLAGLASRLGVPILVGGLGSSPGPDGPRTTNSAFLFQPSGGEVGRYDKVVLVPFGEYVPMVHLLPQAVQDRIKASVRRHFGVYPYMQAGAGPDPLLVEGRTSLRVGVLICYEDVMPGLTAEFVRRGADLLVNPSNEAWYLHGEMDQHLAIARLRAIENRRPMVRATNTGLTAVIDARGRVLAKLLVGGKDRDVEGALRARFPLCRERTLYTRFGPVFSWVSIPVWILLTAVSVFRRPARRAS